MRQGQIDLESGVRVIHMLLHFHVPRQKTAGLQTEAVQVQAERCLYMCRLPRNQGEVSRPPVHCTHTAVHANPNTHVKLNRHWALPRSECSLLQHKEKPTLSFCPSAQQGRGSVFTSQMSENKNSKEQV